MKIGSFILIKNEILWIEAHIRAWLPHLDEMIFFDGNSTDGTLEVIKSFKSKKIRLFEDKDPKDLGSDYVKLFDEALQKVRSEYAFFLHPDMFPISGAEGLKNLGDDELAYFTRMTSYAGDPDGQLYEITSGRMEPWKNIMRKNDPDLGLHYFGSYGSATEDMYFAAVTGDEHEHYGSSMDRYPYDVADSGCCIGHFSDVRSYERRLGRMKSCLRNQGYPEDEVQRLAPMHPRVTLKDNGAFTFKRVEWPKYLKEGINA